MNEEYLKGYFNTYVLPKKQDATYDDWVSKIKDNEQYKQGMFNTYVLPKKQDATYDDWNTKIFGSDLTGATASGKVVPKTETATTTTTTTPKTGYSENITNFVTLYQKDPKTAMQLLPTITEEEIKATPLNSMVKESIIKAKKNLELSNTFKEPILQAGVMRGVEVKAKQKEKDVPTLSFASIYKEAEKQKEDITIPYSSQEQTVTPLPKEDILKANLTLINSYLSKGDVDSYNTALKMTKIQAEKYPYLKSYANRLESYIKREEGDFEGAAKSYDNIEDDSKTISDFNISAYSKVKAGKVEEANEDIDKAIERGNPSDINDIDDLIYSWQLKGNMAYNAGSTELMEQASSKIKELKYAKDRATKDNVFTIFTKTPLTQEEWDKQYNILQKNIFISPIFGPALGAAEAAGMALQGVYEMSTPPPKDKVYTKEEYDKEKNDRVLLGYSKALNGMVSTAFNTFPSIYAFNIGIGAIGGIEKGVRNKLLEATNMPMEELERAKEEEGVIDTVSKWIFAPLTTAIQTWGDYDSLSETQKNFLGLGDVTATILGLSLAHKGVSALKKNILPAIEDYIKAEDKFTTDKGVREFREGEAKVEATAEKIKNIDIDKATLDAIMEMKKEAEPIIAVMDKINKGEPITEAEGKLVVDFIDQTMKDPEFIIKTFKKEPIQVEKKVDNSVQGNLNRLRTEEANIVNKKEYAGIDDLYKAEEIGNEIGALNEKVNKVIAEKTKAVQEQIDLLKQERKDLYDKEGISNEELLANAEIEADINTRLQPLLKEKQNIINEVYELDITELDNILKPKEEAKPITIDEQIAKTEDIINKEGVTDLTEGTTKDNIEDAIDEVKQDVIGTTEKQVGEIPLTETTYNFESVKQENIDRYDYYKKEVDGVTKYFKKEKSAETPIEAQTVKPIRQLGTGANVYYESNKYRVNDFTDGDILLNVGAKDMEVPLANISFKDVNEAVFVAKKLQEIYPTGVPEAVLIDRVIDDFKKEYKVNKATEVKPTTPIEVGKKEVVTDTTNELIINNLNPTGGLLVDYNPKARMTAKLADNITTLDKTMGGSPDDIITIYRGATKKQKKIVPGDYITTNKELAKSYTGDGTVLEMEARKGDILDDINEPLGEEYIYRPKEYEKTRTETQEAVTKPIKGKEQWKGIVIEEGDILSPKDFISKVVSESTSPNELARAYNMEMELIPEQRLGLWQKALSEMANGNISTESFYRHGDRNKTNRTLAKRFLRKNGKPLDTFIIEDLAEAMNAPEGYEMPTPSEVAEFMIDMTSGRVSTRKTSDNSRILASRYKELTGKNIKDHDFKDKRYQLEGDINAEIDATEIPKRWYDDAEMIGDKLSGDINKDDITLDNLDKIEAEAADFMFDSDQQKKEYFQKIRNFLEHEKSRKEKQEANGTQEAGTPLPESSKMGAKPTEGTTAKAEVGTTTKPEIKVEAPEIKEEVKAEVDSLKDVESTSKELKKLQSEDSEFIGDNFSNRETETHILGNIPFKEYKKGDIVNGKEVISDFGTSIKVKTEDPYRPAYTKPRMIDVFINKLDIENSIEGYKTISDYVSEAYHRAKADGSNPELVKAVEDLLGKKTEPEVSGKGKQQVENAYRLKQQAEAKPVEEKQIVQPSPTTTTTTLKVENIKKSSTEIAKEMTTKEKIADANAIIGDELSKLMNQIGVKKGLLPEDKVNIKRLVTAMAEKTGLEIKLVIEKMKAYLEKEYPSSKKEINDVLDEVIKEQETTTTENKKQTASEERTASSERAEEVRRLEEEFNEEVKNMTNEQYEKFKEFKELANTVPETKMIEEYATKGSIEFHQKETPEGSQEYFKMTYMKSLAHSVEAINKARELWGDNFVKKTLDYINTNHVPVQNKTLLYIGLENSLKLEKINFPERAELITKQQNLVWEQSQRYAKTLGQGTAFQNLRAFAEANFEIEKATNEMFTSSELKSKKIIEQRISSNIKDIQKEYEETIETQELEGITDTKTTEVTEVTPAIREMIKKGVETEINKIYEKIPSERKQKIDTYINALSDIQTRLRSRTYEASIGIPVAIIDMGISAIKLALKGGVLLADAIEIGIAKIKELNDGKWEKEEQFRKDITEEFKNKKINVNEKIKTEKPKVEKVKKTSEEIAKEKLERKRASIEKLKEDIKLKRNELKARDVPESDNIQYQILVKEQRSLRKLIEKYIPKDEVLRSEKQTEVISKELLSDIDKINKEIIELEKSLKEKGEPIIDNEKVNNLKIEKKARLELINIVDPTKTDLVKNAMIDAGLTKDKVVKTKDGQKTIKVLDWEKLAGAEGSPELIRQRTEKYLTDKGYSKSDIIRVQDALENQYTALRDQIIINGYNKLESLNKVKMTSEQKTASRKLAEMYNYGLFDRQADTYNYLMNKLLGMDDLSQATFFKTKEIGKVLAELYDTKIFHQDKVDPSSLNHVLNIIDNNLRKLLRAELKNKKGFGAVNVRIARSVQALMELGQRMALNTVKQIIQNPLSGKIQLELAKLEVIFNKTDTKALKEKRKEIKYAILNDIITKGGQYYGKVTSQFLNKGMLDDYINKASDSRIYHMGMSVLLNRAGLEAADAYFKYQITDMYFIQNLVKILTDKTNPNRMRKRDALEFVSERLTGENFKTAESKAIELIKYANKNKPKNQKLIPENKETVLRLADDLVRESLLTGGKITLDQLKAAYEMAYKNAGFDLGHEANNLISWGVRNVSGNLEAAVNKSIKEGRMREATMGIYTSILFRNMMNPFVGGGTNWTVLLAEKAALNPISLVTLIERNARRRKLDVSDGASVRDMREALLRNRNAKSTNTRILAGNIAALLTYIAAKGTGLDDNFEKWISKNEWLRKYVDLFTPEWLILYCHITEKEGLAKYLENTFNSNPAYDKLDGIIKGLSDISSKGDGTRLGVALGQFFNAPTPWRLARDIESIYRGATGKPQRARSPKPKGIIEGFFIYGMINYLKQKEGTYKEQAIIDEVEKKRALVDNEEAKRIDYIERANNRNIEIPKNATMEEAEQIVKTYNFDKRVENYNNKLKLYTKEELKKIGIYEPTESGGSKSTKGKGKLSKSKKSKK